MSKTNAPKLDTDTLLGDVRAGILDLFRAQSMTWSMMTEAQQRGFVHEVHERADYLVRECVNLVASEGRPVIVAKMGEVKHAKSGVIECKVSFDKHDERRHAAFDATGDPVLLVIANVEGFLGERAPADADINPDQPDMLRGAA